MKNMSTSWISAEVPCRKHNIQMISPSADSVFLFNSDTFSFAVNEYFEVLFNDSDISR